MSERGDSQQHNQRRQAAKTQPKQGRLGGSRHRETVENGVFCLHAASLGSQA
jgi:hypothetical protein